MLTRMLALACSEVTASPSTGTDQVMLIYLHSLLSAGAPAGPEAAVNPLLEVQYVQPEASGSARGADPAPQLPLWLTEEQAELLLSLCATSPTSGGHGEREVFTKLGDLLRAFWR
jgi:hypothetical protein